MPRYLVHEKRSFVEVWLIDADDEEQARLRNGTVVDEADHAWHDSVSESIDSREVDSDRRYV